MTLTVEYSPVSFNTVLTLSTQVNGQVYMQRMMVPALTREEHKDAMPHLIRSMSRQLFEEVSHRELESLNIVNKTNDKTTENILRLVLR